MKFKILSTTAAMGLIAGAVAFPAYAQQTTTPDGKGCSAAANSAECANQSNEATQSKEADTNNQGVIGDGGQPNDANTTGNQPQGGASPSPQPQQNNTTGNQPQGSQGGGTVGGGTPAKNGGSGASN